ncbi:MAG: TetR family transcriptional regulator [Myxococcales bacterium]|nr:TetR family transcriptional regulator [Myxococcales bacterium]
MTSDKKSERTRAAILRAALGLFRRKGFDRTTMRDVARAAEVAVGAAYYYFPSKDALVLAYYAEVQRACTERADRDFAATDDPRERLRAAIRGKLEILARDRRLLSALFRTMFDPNNALSVFGEASRGVREESIATFARALETSDAVRALSESDRRVLALSTWSLHMGILLYFLHDASAGAAKTHALADAAVDLVADLLPASPLLAASMGARLSSVLDAAGLLGPALGPSDVPNGRESRRKLR